MCAFPFANDIPAHVHVLLSCAHFRWSCRIQHSPLLVCVYPIHYMERTIMLSCFLHVCGYIRTSLLRMYVCMYVCMHIVYINQIERAWILKVLCVGDFMLVGMSEVIRACLPQLVMYMLYTCMYRLWGRACCVSTGLPYIHVVTLGFLCMWYGSARGHYHALENVVTLQGQLGY